VNMNMELPVPPQKTDEIATIIKQSDLLIESLGTKPENLANYSSTINELKNTLQQKTLEQEQRKKQRIKTEQQFEEALKQLAINNNIVEELKNKHQTKIKECKTLIASLQNQFSVVEIKAKEQQNLNAKQMSTNFEATELLLQGTSSLRNWLTALGIVNITTIALLVWLWHYTHK
jgi:hypothetical protein